MLFVRLAVISKTMKMKICHSPTPVRQEYIPVVATNWLMIQMSKTLPFLVQTWRLCMIYVAN